MATGVPPRDHELNITRSDLENLQEAMKNKKFRDIFAEYCEEVRDPANVKIYQEEMTQLEKERGYNVTFINPKAGYVIKTSVAGEQKAFINICSSDHVEKPSCKVQEQDGQRGMNWLIPYSLIPPREDYNDKRERCIIYDVVFHPDTLRMAEVNKRFRELVNKTAFDGLQNSYNIHLDNNNCRFPKSYYKGVSVPAVIRSEDPDYQPPTEEELNVMTPEMIEKMYPQRLYPDKTEEPKTEAQRKSPQKKRKTNKVERTEFKHESDNGYTLPKYVMKQQKSIELQDFTYNRDCKQYSAIPSHICIEINLPLLTSTKNCVLDVQERSLNLVSEKPAKYKLNIPLPYPVNDQCGTAKFDKSRHMLIVTLPVINKTQIKKNDLKADSGVESEENSGSHSEDESPHHKLVEEISSTPLEPIVETTSVKTSSPRDQDTFFDPSLGYILPSYTHNVLDNIVAFTFHVKNTEPDSVKVKKDGKNIYIKFTTIGAGFVPVHYAAVIVFEDSAIFENVNGESWDNNVILQVELTGDVPQKFQIGLSEDSLTCDSFDMSQVKKSTKIGTTKDNTNPEEVESAPVIEVTSFGSETNILVSSTNSEYDEDDDDDDDDYSPTSKDEITCTESGSTENGAKSILRKTHVMRSFSESSAGDLASSMDYVSSDCIPEESSYKKTVRFNDEIKKQFYRYNSSIEGQKKKNQRKKGKKRLERRKSESEAEDDIGISLNAKPRKSALKPRHDSGLADTSDADTESKNTPVEDSVFDNINKSQVNNEYEKENRDEDDYDSCTELGEPSETSVLDIVANKNKGKDSEPTLWETETKSSVGPDPDTNPEARAEKPEPITCDNIKHKNPLYNPDKLNKGQYLEVSFKNDLIFDLDM